MRYPAYVDGLFHRIKNIDIFFNLAADWNNGWYDNRERFRVYRPDYPRAYSGGYALRAHIVWWLAHKECHPKGTNLHHKNHIKAIVENLAIGMGRAI